MVPTPTHTEFDSPRHVALRNTGHTIELTPLGDPPTTTMAHVRFPPRNPLLALRCLPPLAPPRPASISVPDPDPFHVSGAPYDSP